MSYPCEICGGEEAHICFLCGNEMTKNECEDNGAHETCLMLSTYPSTQASF